MADPASPPHGRVAAGTAEATDLRSRSDVHDLVVRFYREVVFDDLLAPVFAEVAEVDWSEHIPKLIDYWCRVLLDEPGYDGSILAAHRHVHGIDPFRVEHFDRWYGLWAGCLDDGWVGPVAERAKGHAARIGGSLARRLLDVDWRPPPAGTAPAATAPVTGTPADTAVGTGR